MSAHTVGQIARLLQEMGDARQGLALTVLDANGNELALRASGPLLTLEGGGAAPAFIALNVEAVAQPASWIDEVAHVPRNDGAQYVCHWGPGYGECADQTKGREFFTCGLGYDADTVAQIMALAVGATADLSDPSGVHTVRRIA